jgi:hypothetical protein
MSLTLELEVPEPLVEKDVPRVRLGIRKITITSLDGGQIYNMPISGTNCGTCDGCTQTVFSKSCSCPLSYTCNGCTTTAAC